MMDSGWWLAMKVIASLTMVLSAFLLLVWYVKRAAPTMVGSGSLRLRGRLSIAPGAELILVQAARKLYLVAFSAQGFALLDNLGEDGLEADDQSLPSLQQGDETTVGSEVISQLLRLDRMKHVRKGEGR